MTDDLLIQAAQSRETMLVRALVELADTLVDDFDVVDLLTVLTTRCVEVLDLAAAGLMILAPSGDLRVMASSSKAMRVLELFEIQAHEGPCMDCFSSGTPIVNHQLSPHSGRWPRFTAEALAAGFTSVHAMPMRMRGTIIGALNLFSTDPAGLGPHDVDAARALADVATIGVLQHRAALEVRLVNDQLQHALSSRIVIEQAKGMVAERTGLGMESSFAQMRAYARANNIRLADLAQALASSEIDASSLAPTPRADPGRS